MRLSLHTAVQQSPAQVFAGFHQDLFKRLAPPFPPVKLLRFDGSKAGDTVSLELNFLLFRQRWDSFITEYYQSPQEIYFVDEGIRLPFFLKYWRHKHRIVAAPAGAVIIDEITFKAPFLLLTWLLYPALYLQFLYRKPIYKKIFK
jgi:ligand-binding SRPBCC domain-containing protein